MLTDPNALAAKAYRDARDAIGEAPSDSTLEQRTAAAQAAIAAVYAPRLAELEAEVERRREALVVTEGAIAEYYRYWTGGETRGSYDGKPERAGLWKAQQIARQAIAAALKENPHD